MFGKAKVILTTDKLNVTFDTEYKHLVVTFGKNASACKEALCQKEMVK